MEGRKNLHSILFSLLIMLLAGPAFGLNLTRVDMSHQYDPDAPVKLQYRVTQDGRTVTVYLLITTDSSTVWTKEYFIQRGYASEDHRVFFPQINEVESTDSMWRGSISFQPTTNEELLVINFASDFNFYFDVPLTNGRSAFPSFFPMGKEQPLLTSYLTTADLSWSTEATMEVTSYSDRFGPADAPMEEMKQLAPRLFVDSTYLVDETFELVDYKFYYFRNDTLVDQGLALMKSPPYYPAYRLIGELIPPMKYLTTEAEYRTLTTSTRPKRTFDEFWINTYGTKFRARNAIRKYYKSVEYANHYFTTYKQGWKTDRGIIFIMYGTPYEMYRNDTGETWLYDNIEFEFIKVSTLFGDTFVLRKDRNYEKEWYKQVGRLRKGE